MATSNYKTPT